MNNTVEPTWFLGLKIMWAWTWRCMVLVTLSYIPLLIIGAIIGGIGGAILGGEAAGSFIGLFMALFFIGYFVFIIYIYGFIFQRMMTKGFGKYRLMVIEKEKS